MTRLANFALGAALAATLMGPAAWATAGRAVHTGVSVAAAAVLSGPSTGAKATAVVRSAVLPTP